MKEASAVMGLKLKAGAPAALRVLPRFPSGIAPLVSDSVLETESTPTPALLPRASGNGRAAALEILVATPAIRNLIRDDKVHQIYSTMQSGQEKYGMQTMNQSLARLAQSRVISRETAMAATSNREELIQMLEKPVERPRVTA